MNFVCEKCEKGYASKRALINHNEKVPFCNMVAPAILTNNNEIVELKNIIMVLVNEVKSLKEAVAILTTNITQVPPILPSIVVVEQMKTNELTEKDKYIQSHSELDIRHIKKIKKIENPAPTFKHAIVQPTTDQDHYDPCPILQSVLNQLKEERKNNTPPTQMITDALYYSNDNLFEYNKEVDKTIICEEELDNFIESCATLYKQTDLYFKICKRTFNNTTGIYNDRELDRLYILNEDNIWEWSETKLINKIRCRLYDVISSAVATSALVYRNYADRLMAIKRINYDDKSIDSINEKLLMFLKCNTI